MSLLNTIYTFSQNNEEAVEQILEKVSLDTDESEDIELIEYYRQYPIELLTASGEDLAFIPGISILTGKRIEDFLDQNEFYTYAILADSLSLTPWQEILLENCTLPTAKKSDNYHHFSWRVRNMSRIGNIKGVVDDRFEGSELDLYQRGIYKNKYLQTGFLTNKDMGERSITDFYSAYVETDISLSESIRINAIAGDYYLEAGMGGLFWRSFGIRKSASGFGTAINPGKGLRRYSSAFESQFFRGGAINTNFEIDTLKFDITGFYSNRKLGANIDEENGEATSIYITGLYRTDTEIEKTDRLSEQAAGGILEAEYWGLKAGIAGYYLEYDRFVNSESSSAFKGKSGFLGSSYLFYTLNSSLISAELSFDAKSNHNLKAGFMSESKEFDFLLYYRNSHRDFRSPFGYNFGEFSYAANENGIFAGLYYKGLERVSSGLIVDLYESDGSTYLVPGKVSGIETEIQIDYKLSGSTILTCRADHEQKIGSIRDDNYDKYIYEHSRSSIRMEMRNDLSRRFMFRMRLELCYVDKENYEPSETGIMSFAELKWTPWDAVRIGARYSVFSSETYDSAIWQFEYAMPGIMSTRALYGEGTRAYVYIRVKPLNYLTIWARYAELTKNNVDVSGSGLLQTDGNIERQLYFQLELDI